MYRSNRSRLPTLAVLLASPLLAALLPAAAPAQPATLVKDAVTTGVNGPQLLFFTSLVAELDGIGYFFSDDGIHGRELWRTDGTEAGTWMVRDVCPGQCTGLRSVELTPFQGRLYFSADDGVHGQELWRTDGTFDGTELVADALPGGGGSNPDWLTVLGDRLLFSARGEEGRALWATDGTPAGTEQVLAFNPGGTSEAGSFVVWKGAAWFVARDAAHGPELWTTDGTTGGTHLVKDVWPGTTGGLGSDQTPIVRYYTPVPYGDLLLFPADDGVHGAELWATDGTEAGTAMLADIDPGFSGSEPHWLTPFAGEVYFVADQATTGRNLWKTDGTPGGTGIVLDLEPGPDGWAGFPLEPAGGLLFFPAATTAEGTELWASDGTAGGTHLVEDVDPGPTGALAWTFGFGLRSLGSKLVFQADDGTHGLEPWVSDGTPEGTDLLADLSPGADPSFVILYDPLLGGNLDGRSLFFAYEPTAGWELRSTGGVPGDVELVKDVDRQQSSIYATPFWRLTDMEDTDGTLFYVALDPDHGVELWASDGTEGGTRLVRDLLPGPELGHPWELTSLGSLLFFNGPGDGDDRWLWTSDGMEAGTTPLVGAGTQPLDPRELTPFAGRMYFAAHDTGGSFHVWVSDGTDAGTHPFPEGSPVEDVNDLAASTTDLFAATPAGLWGSRGDAATTQLLSNVEARWETLVPAGPLLFFAGDDGASGREPWVSDGTPGGTHRILDLVPGPEGSIPTSGGFMLPYPDGPGIAGVAAPPSAFFVAEDGVHGKELWWTDGTEPGTRLLGDLRPGALGSEPRYLTVVGRVAYFVANDGAHGAELWRSDGTEAGTYLLADLEPGPGSSIPDSLAAVYGDLFFSAWRTGDGRELWRSDGTEAGTAALQDVNPGAGSSSPGYFTTSGGRLFFTANDGERGFELWSLSALPPRLVGTKTVGGDLRAGGQATYVITLENPGDFAQHDNPGDELVDELPEGLTVTAATADTGTTTVDPDARTVRWNGAVPAGGTVTITIQAAITLDAAGTTLVNQAQIAYDGDGSGDNETLAATDDPTTEGATDPTTFVVGEPFLVEVPALSPAALALLALLLAAAGLALSRRA